MAKKTPNHTHQKNGPAQNTTAPNKAGDDEAPGMSGQGSQERDPKGRVDGQFTGAGEPGNQKK